MRPDRINKRSKRKRLSVNSAKEVYRLHLHNVRRFCQLLLQAARQWSEYETWIRAAVSTLVPPKRALLPVLPDPSTDRSKGLPVHVGPGALWSGLLPLKSWELMTSLVRSCLKAFGLGHACVTLPLRFETIHGQSGRPILLFC